MVKKYLLVLFFGIFLISLVSASFELGNESHLLDKNYTQGESLTGWINLSFNNETLDTLFFDTFGNNFSLQELADNSNFSYEENETYNTINSSFQKIYLDSLNLKLTNFTGNVTYELSIGSEEILSEDFFIEKKENLTLKTTARNLLNEKKSYLENINSELIQFDLFIQKMLNGNFNSLNLSLISLESFYENASDSEDYEYIVSKLNELNIPQTISITKTTEGTGFSLSEDNINLDIVSQVAGGIVEGGEEDYRGAIFLWNEKNMNTKISYNEITIDYGNSNFSVLNYFEFDFGELPGNEVYFMIEDIDDLKFKENYGFERAGRYSYLKLTEDIPTIAFTTTEEVGFADVPVIISPSLDTLAVTELGEVEIGGGDFVISKWLFFTLAIVFLLILFFVVYYILHTWYDKKYEKYLFPNKNDLYNLILYINNAKKKGLENDKIEKNLRSSKWTSEQVRYVMRKYAGKRTGMILLPFMKKKIKKVSEDKKGTFLNKQESFRNKNLVNKSVLKIPIGVKIISVLYYIFGGIFILFGVFFMFFESIINLLFSTSLPIFGADFFLGIFLIILGLVDIFLGISLRKGKNWARILIVVFSISGIGGGLSSLGSFYSIISILVLVVIAGYLLFSKKAKNFFRKTTKHKLKEFKR